MPLSADGSAYEVAHGAAYACTFDDAVCLDDGRLIAVAPSGAVRGWVVDQYNGRGLSSGEVAQGKELLAAARRQDRLIVPLGIGDTTNYYHWTYQALSRVHLARRYLGAERCVFHVGPTRFPYVIGSMAALGIDERDIVSGGPVRGKVVYTHTPSMFPPSWVTRFLREVGDRVCEGVSLAPRRTYYHRGGAQRKLANDGQVSELVVRYGFGICRPDEMSFEEQVRTARASTVLLGVHGACFTNLAYSTPGSTTVELMPRNMPQPYYMLISRDLGLHHNVQFGKEPRVRNLLGKGPFYDYSADLVADLKGLERNLERLGE